MPGSATLESSALGSSVADLERVRGTAEGVTRSAALAFRDFESLQATIRAQASAICSAKDIAAKAFAEAGAQSGVLRVIAARLAADMPGDPDTLATADTTWIFALYTMEEERAVHRALFPADEEPAGADGSEVDELDDFLL